MATTYVKTTVELPEYLMRQLKLRSVLRNEKLKDTLAEVIENGLLDTGNRTPIKLRPPIKSLDGHPFSTEEMQRFKEEGRS